MKKIALFGATGRTGKYILQFALDEGHSVTAFVRDAEKLGLFHTNLKIVEGDVKDAKKVSEAIAGVDAVISALAPVRGGPMDVMEKGAKNIVSAMKEHGVRRLVFTTGAGVPSPDDVPNLMSKFMGFLLKRISGEVLEDSNKGVETIKQSDLSWTIVRGPMLKDAPRDGNYKVGYAGKGMGRTLSRGNFADFIVKTMTDETYLHKMPAVSDG